MKIIVPWKVGTADVDIQGVNVIETRTKTSIRYAIENDREKREKER